MIIVARAKIYGATRIRTSDGTSDSQSQSLILPLTNRETAKPVVASNWISTVLEDSSVSSLVDSSNTGLLDATVLAMAGFLRDILGGQKVAAPASPHSQDDAGESNITLYISST
jgi:hypothetical protein